MYPINVTLSDPGSKLGNYAVTTNAGFLTITSSLPVIAFITPAANDTINAGGTTTVTVTATDSDGTIAKVEFYEGAARFSAISNSPYTATWTNTFAGDFILTAVATDNAGGTNSVSLPLSVNAVFKNPVITSSNFSTVFYGLSNYYYYAQYSTNLTNWMPLKQFRSTGPETIIDATNTTGRFYRIIPDL